MVKMVIIFKMVIIVEMVKMVEMVTIVVMAMVIRLSMLIIVIKVTMVETVIMVTVNNMVDTVNIIVVVDCKTFTTQTFTTPSVKSDVHHPRRSPPQTFTWIFLLGVMIVGGDECWSVVNVAF